ncbi:hypothetical protein O9992_10690 [Vibrio lentus]|nr:hypothetical protein [Vibrio lentus]
MKQAVYNADNAGHFSLALKRYIKAFFLANSSFLRFAIAVRLSTLLRKEEGRNSERWTPTGGYHYTFDDMDFYGEQCSMTERRADDHYVK